MPEPNETEPQAAPDAKPTRHELFRMLAEPGYFHQRAQGVETSSDGGYVDLRATLFTIWNGRRTVFVATALAVTAAVAVLSQMAPVYRAETVLLLESKGPQVIDLPEVLARPNYGKDALRNEIAVLNSTELLSTVVARLGLETRPGFLPEPTAPRAYEELPVLGDLAQMMAESRTALGYGATPQPAATALTRLRKGLEITPVTGSQVLEISYRSGDPALAAEIANAVAQTYVTSQLETKRDATRAANGWLNERVADLRGRVQAAEAEVETLRATLSADAGQSLEAVEEERAALVTSLTAAQRTRTELANRHTRLASALAAGDDPAIVPEFRAAIGTRQARETELTVRLAALETAAPAGHAIRNRVETELAEVQSLIRQEAARIVAAAAHEERAAQAREASLAEALKGVEARLFAQTRDHVALREAEREAEASRLLYETFLTRFKETAEQEDLVTADARILSPADTPFRPERERAALVIGLSVLAGLCLGVAGIFLRETLNNTFRTPRELEEQTGQSVLATLPDLGKARNRRDVIANVVLEPRSSFAEGIRGLRTSLLFSGGVSPRVVLVTSALPHEGKTTTSALLGMSSQQLGRSSIVVDCDLRRPSFAGLIEGAAPKSGLIDVLKGKADWRDALRHDEATGLALLTDAGGNGDPALAVDLLSSPRFRALIAELGELYELVVLDAPPTLVVSDARILANHVDAVVYAVRWDKTPRGAALQGLRDLATVRAPIAGLVMTMTDEARAEQYAYEGYRYDRGRYPAYITS